MISIVDHTAPKYDYTTYVERARAFLEVLSLLDLRSLSRSRDLFLIRSLDLDRLDALLFFDLRECLRWPGDRDNERERLRFLLPIVILILMTERIQPVSNCIHKHRYKLQGSLDKLN